MNMQNEKISELKEELVQINAFLKNTLTDPSTFEIVDMVSRRSFIIRKLAELKWASKNKQERIEQRKSDLKGLEKYHEKYGEAERDVSEKFIYRSIYLKVIVSLNELSLSIDDNFQDLKVILTAMDEILDNADFVDIRDPTVSVSLNALSRCLALNQEKMSEGLRSKIDEVRETLASLMNS
jgi:chorismate mutase